MDSRNEILFTVNVPRSPLFQDRRKIKVVVESLREQLLDEEGVGRSPKVRAMITSLDLDMENESTLHWVRSKYIAELLTRYGRQAPEGDETRKFIVKLVTKLGYCAFCSRQDLMIP